MKFCNNEIEMLEVGELTANANNAKIHDEEQIEKIKESILEFGFKDPIGIDENNRILEGHGRLLAAVELGIAKVPCVRIVGLSDEEKTAYSLVHNQLTNNTDFDLDKLDAELDAIKDIDMRKYNFLLGEDSYFDESKEHETSRHGQVEVIAAGDEADLLREWLDDNLVTYKEKYVR